MGYTFKERGVDFETKTNSYRIIIASRCHIPEFFVPPLCGILCHILIKGGLFMSKININYWISASKEFHKLHWNISELWVWILKVFNAIHYGVKIGISYQFAIKRRVPYPFVSQYHYFRREHQYKH